MSNSYQRAKARVKELEEQDALRVRHLSNEMEKNAQLYSDLILANKKIELQEHFAKLSEKDIREKNEIIASNQKTIKRLVILAIGLVLGIIGLIATS